MSPSADLDGRHPEVGALWGEAEPEVTRGTAALVPRVTRVRPRGRPLGRTHFGESGPAEVRHVNVRPKPPVVREIEPVVVRIAQPAPDRVLFGARARTRTAAAYGIARMRFALGVDEDLSAFLRAFGQPPQVIRRNMTYLKAIKGRARACWHS